MTKRICIMGITLLFSVVYTYIRAQTHIVITEIMANPNNGQLPQYEYIEIFNKGSTPVQLNECHLTVRNSKITLPTHLLAPNEYALLCNKAAQTHYASYGTSLALTTWPALTNSGTTISILRNNIPEDIVTYSDSWYGSSAKKSGGWSLERINIHISCNISSNWSATIDELGGTPCSSNSILNDKHVPSIQVTHAQMQENRIALTFNADISEMSFKTDDFVITPQNIQPHAIEISSQKDSIYIYFRDLFDKNTLYNLSIREIDWCSHKILLESIGFFLPGEVIYNDVIINEVLFNPKAGGTDFVELLNRSSEAINIQGWKIGNRIISSNLLILESGQHLALTTDVAFLYTNYQAHEKQRIEAIPSLPAFANEQGVITLFSPDRLIDSLRYTSSMHHPMLKNRKGISLERQSPDLPTNSTENFKSASTLSGGATPGYKNSTEKDPFSKKNVFFLTSKTVSPDHDSFEDFMELNYRLQASHYRINATIYDQKGRVINRLIRQQSAGSSGKIQWNCSHENSHLVPEGVYLIQVEIYDEKGYQEATKEAFVVTHKRANY